jgi:hypothetical protein
MKKTLGLILLLATSISFALSAQSAPDVSTLDWLASQKVNSTGTNLLSGIAVCPDFNRGDEIWIYVPLALDRKQFSEEFFNMTQLRFITPPVEKVGDELYRIDMATLPPCDYTVYFRYREQLETRRMRLLSDRLK